jgi:uncharacterized membrane protein
MEAIRKSIEIRASADQVFAYLADPENDPLWVPSLMEVRNISGSGSELRYEWTYKMVGFKLDGKTRSVEHVPNERLVMTTHGGVDSKWIYQLTPTAAGTRFDLSVEYEIPLPVLGKLAEKLVARANERELEVAIHNVKDQCEARAEHGRGTADGAEQERAPAP